MRVLVGQISPIIGDVRGNLEKCIAAVQAARVGACRLVVLPELVLSGYPPRDLLERRDLLQACEQAAAQLAACSSRGLTIVFGVPLEDQMGLRNAAVVAHGGRVHAVVNKTRLPTYDVFDEARWFIPETRPLPVEVGGLRIGVTICEDIWEHDKRRDLPTRHPYAVDPLARMRNCDVILNLSASPFHAGKDTTRLNMLRRHARDHDTPIVYCNMVGGNDELLFDGDSLVMAPDGRTLARGPAFEPANIVVDVDGPGIVARPLSHDAAIVAALEMGVRDYAARCGFKTALLGLSGGIDSALVAVIAARALGPENVYTVGMPGPFSSQGSVDDARALAQNLGVRFDLVGIDGIHDAFLSTLAPTFEGHAADVTEENLQARARGTVLMAMSNKFGHLLLTTGNKSELAVGYCTLYGDMNGGLAVISDLFKTEVQRICAWLNRNGEVIPQAILDKPPSAELAPDQRDEDSLPPYAALDALLSDYLLERRSPEELISAGHDAATVHRVCKLVNRTEYKRWQAAPGLRVSPRAFGSGRRIPLARRWPIT